MPNFPPEPTVQRVPTKLDVIEVELTSRFDDDDDPTLDVREAIVAIRIDDQFGKPMRWVNADLKEHLPTNVLQDLNDFMDFLRNKAESEILP